MVARMSNRMEQVAQSATQGGAIITVSAFFSLGWWNENSAAIVAMAAVFGAVCSGVGLAVSIYLKYRERR